MVNLKTNKKLIILIIIIHICYLQKTLALTIGSNTSISRESASFFPGATDNEILGFAAMAEGFSFIDTTASCSFNAFFPVSKNINLVGGKLYLNKDLILNNTANFTNIGSIYGNNKSIIFSKTIENRSLPLSYLGILNLIDQKTMGRSVRSIDWMYDDNYIVAGSRVYSGGSELEVFSFNGSSMTSVAQAELGDHINSLRCHPNNFYIAIARNSNPGDELRVYYFNTSTNTLSIVDSLGINQNVYAVAWNSGGNYLATGRNITSNELEVYSFISETLTSVATANISPDRRIQENTISWSKENSYFAVGLLNDATPASDEILIYYFDGSSLTLTAGTNANATVEAVDWSPTGSFIAAGLAGSTDRLRIYEHNINNGTFIERTSARVGVDQTIFSVSWSQAGDSLAVGANSASGDPEFMVYSFDKENITLNLLSALESSNDVRAVSYSNNGNYVARGDDANIASVFGFTSRPFLIDNTNLIINSDTTIDAPLNFYGTCLIDTQGNKLTIGSQGEILVADTGTLTIKNASISNLKNNNLRCEQTNGTISLKNCSLYLSNNFEYNTGSIILDRDIIISGTTQFTYSSPSQLTINTNSCLSLNSGLIFSYAPSSNNRDLLYMTDNTSQLFLNGCTIQSTTTGLRLTNGKLFIDNQVTFNSEGTAASEAISLGNGTAINDLDVYLLSAAELNISGPLEYENVE